MSVTVLINFPPLAGTIVAWFGRRLMGDTQPHVHRRASLVRRLRVHVGGRRAGRQSLVTGPPESTNSVKSVRQNRKLS